MRFSAQCCPDSDQLNVDRQQEAVPAVALAFNNTLLQEVCLTLASLQCHRYRSKAELRSGYRQERRGPDWSGFVRSRCRLISLTSV